ncbi:MAG: type II toxin-antitoxin system HipA family toxin [Actinobacteria bacterium]|nr:type II toxin-antitoxin system HipA family toxin [Actinomycetota bacterium]
MVAFINIWNRRVGAVSWDEERRLATMEFDENFIKEGIDLSPIIMPLSKLIKGNRIYSFENLPEITYKGLPGLLADSLPDRYGNRLINEWLAIQGRSEEDFSTVDRLCYIGKRGMGALEYEPAILGKEDRSESINIEELAELARHVLNERKKLNPRSRISDKNTLNEIIRVGTSAGGARAKAVIAINNQTGGIRSGQVDVPEGFEHWILKFDGIKDNQLGEPAGYGRVEYAYHKMAKDAGINMEECRLIEENSRAHFMTKRFDRKPGNERIHMQTLCAIAHFDYNDPNSYSYEQLFQIIRKIRLPYADAREIYRRIVFNIAGKNLDDHTKNISFLLRENQSWRLSPAYDLIYNHNPEGKWTRRHQMSVNGKRENISYNDLITLGNENSIKSPKEIIEQVLEVLNNWKKYAKDIGLEKRRIEEINKNMELNIK